MQRITDVDIHIKTLALARLINNDKIDLHLGNREYKITNKLVINNTNVWPDAMAGYSKREAYNALRLMIAALSITK